MKVPPLTALFSGPELCITRLSLNLQIVSNKGRATPHSIFMGLYILALLDMVRKQGASHKVVRGGQAGPK